MFCRYLIFVIALDVINSMQLRNEIKGYFQSDAVDDIRQGWQHYRKAIENALERTLQETIGKEALNVIILKSSGLKLARAFYHSHGHVQIILNDLQLAELPQCWLPEVSFSLASNVLKLETKLTKMRINADYSLLRNKSDIIIDALQQDSFRNSPFLFQPVQSMGKLTLSLEGCFLSGYIMARLGGSSVNLGHHKFLLTKCDYNVEIYQPGTGAPPIMAKFSAKVPGSSFSINNLVLKPLEEEFVAKLQSAVFSYVNASAIYGKELSGLQDDQNAIFRTTARYLTCMVRELNRNIATVNDGAYNFEDYVISWDDFTPYNLEDFLPAGTKSMGGIMLSNMVLTGLDTAYISNSGGPYKLDNIMVGEQIRFSLLQVRGDIFYTRRGNDHFEFSLSISDLALNIDAPVDSEDTPRLDVVSFRKIDFSEPALVFKPVEGIIIGHLMHIIPKYICNIIKIDLSKTYISPKGIDGREPLVVP